MLLMEFRPGFSNEDLSVLLIIGVTAKDEKKEKQPVGAYIQHLRGFTFRRILVVH